MQFLVSREWIYIGLYANPKEIMKKELWKQFTDFKNKICVLWIIIGDFNEIISLEKKIREALADLNRCVRFREKLTSYGLVDLGSSGCRFTQRG